MISSTSKKFNEDAIFEDDDDDGDTVMFASTLPNNNNNNNDNIANESSSTPNITSDVTTSDPTTTTTNTSTNTIVYGPPKIELQRFFGYNQFDIRAKEQNDKRYQNISSTLTLYSEITYIIAPQKALKSSLLFQYGYSFAREDKFVLYCCNKKRFEESAPFGVPSHLSIDNNDVAFKNIKIKTFEDDSNMDLRHYFMDFPSYDILPDLILIDDFTFCFNSGSNLFTDYAKTLAYIKDTLSFINHKRQLEKKQSPCFVIITDSTYNDKFHYALPRWVNLILTIDDTEQLIFQQQQLLQQQQPTFQQQQQQILLHLQNLKERNLILKVPDRGISFGPGILENNRELFLRSTRFITINDMIVLNNFGNRDLTWP
ncbi:hypothetical protein DFA_03478 [Cavenderia fasciculata]|uniref:Uncharacterized protein n=1 Tax=Cavenderia fasciculata TaxID=261658 RepID=F4PHP6_CACFS|nr:uncharacterized protein DFA_03478 [Cavenderia fasciculata]EGG25230.1 hypothetical protein DFA_03478 [Cavenderia fasciculata]|eukprot:XP_004363081.1 hypothetical protein DFA_03478 [Cavenderia fasciculata]